MKIIINADDYGMHKDINDGIIKAYNDGVLTSTTVMMNYCDESELLRLRKEAKGIGIGIHFTLTQGFPLTDVSFKRIDGKFDRVKLYNGEFCDQEIKNELRSQLNKMFAFGVIPTHIDSHHHIHLRPRILKIIETLAKEHNLLIRDHNKQIKFIGSFYHKNVTYQHLKEILSINVNQTIEVMCHPGFAGASLFKETSYNGFRAAELSILISDEIKNMFNTLGYVKGTYLDFI